MLSAQICIYHTLLTTTAMGTKFNCYTLSEEQKQFFRYQWTISNTIHYLPICLQNTAIDYQKTWK